MANLLRGGRQCNGGERTFCAPLKPIISIHPRLRSPSEIKARSETGDYLCLHYLPR